MVGINRNSLHLNHLDQYSENSSRRPSLSEAGLRQLLVVSIKLHMTLVLDDQEAYFIDTRENHPRFEKLYVSVDNAALELARERRSRRYNSH